jgi:molybdopterin synthase catalytic subunit
LFDICEEPLDIAPLIEAVSDPGHGAIVTFLGVVRKSGPAGPVSALEYSAYREMALVKLREIGDELSARYGPMKIAAVHRVGKLDVGVASLALAVGAPHRAEAWRASEEFVDRLKEIVPIWKKDVALEGGSA